MQWKCPNCEASVRAPDDTPSVRCRCGYVDHRDGTGSFVGSGVFRNVWYKAGRQAVCLGCEQYINQRCKQVELGCKCAYQRLVEDADGRCPLGKWAGHRVQFVKTESLARDAMLLADKVPACVVRVIGVPRSGMIAAAVIATKLQLPLYSLSAGGEVLHVGHGTRIRGELPTGGLSLLVDDTVHSGQSIQQARRNMQWSGEIVTAAVYTANPGKTDFYQELLPTPHLLEWNMFNSPFASNVAFDLDGVLCHNPPRSLEPLYVLRHTPAKAIITARLVAERDETERWLSRYGNLYSALHMWEGSDKERNNLAAVARWKSLKTAECFADLYVESEPALADAMRRNGTIVLCPAQGYLE